MLHGELRGVLAKILESFVGARTCGKFELVVHDALREQQKSTCESTRNQTRNGTHLVANEFETDALFEGILAQRLKENQGGQKDVVNIVIDAENEGKARRIIYPERVVVAWTGSNIHLLLHVTGPQREAGPS